MIIQTIHTDNLERFAIWEPDTMRPQNLASEYSSHNS